MKTILYRIPNDFFPGVFVKQPFHAKVNYAVKDGKVQIYDVAVSPLCLEHLHNPAGLRKKIQEKVESVETKAVSIANINPIIANAIAPHIHY